MSPSPDGPNSDLLVRIEARLADLVPVVLAGQQGLEAAMRDSLLAPGKRLRPLIAAIVAQDLGGPLEAALDAGCAVEMVHAASLILDDLPCMDDAALRRGRPAIHRGHGEDVAVLASIALLTEAFAVLARIEGLAPERRSAAVGVLASAVGSLGLVGGQYQDLRGGRGARSAQDMADANGRKTGALFLSAVELGAIVAGATPGQRANLCAFAGELGLAFQLLDDLLDLSADPAAIGKDVGRDAGKSTVVALVGVERTQRLVERHIGSARAHLETVFGAGSRLDALIEALAVSGRALADAAARPLEQEGARR
ncbi:polyprenyl synthetase family protein [Aureimonas flava]|uniref:Probable farnesyl diphosphate synthase n=1 Tax=Aureimonas flava TaxID=2320271 RepID=A0A3A1WGV2_9HYPH|nr:polyprenyl synthetase family protein [Aureimonas flava]RIX99626.1 polyprenyl synthetase family protein [Aureimonas flava]